MGAFKRAFPVFCLGLFGMIPTAAVSQWVMVEPAQDYYIDVASIQKEGETVTYWGKYKVLPGYIQEIMQQVPQGADAEYLVEKNQINCSDRTIRFMRDTIHNTQGEAIISQNYPSQWHPILPRTVAEEEWRFVCNPPPLPLIHTLMVTEM